MLRQVGLGQIIRAGREVRYQVIGTELSATARQLDAIGAQWHRRLAAIRHVAENL